MEKTELTGMTRDEMTAWVRDHGLPAFRGKQIFEWIHRGADFDTMTNLSDMSLYPGERTIFPGIMPVERRRAEGSRPWMRNVPEAVYEGSHIVLSVPPGGETYKVTCLTAADESMRIKAEFGYRSRCSTPHGNPVAHGI